MAEHAPGPVHLVVLVDAIHAKIRNGAVSNRPEGPARGGGGRLAAGHRADLRRELAKNMLPPYRPPLWGSAWEFTSPLRFDTEIRCIVWTTNAIESVNARVRRAAKARGHLSNEQAALKYVCMPMMSLDPTRKGLAARPSGARPR